MPRGGGEFRVPPTEGTLRTPRTLRKPWVIQSGEGRRGGTHWLAGARRVVLGGIQQKCQQRQRALLIWQEVHTGRQTPTHPSKIALTLPPDNRAARIDSPNSGSATRRAVYASPPFAASGAPEFRRRLRSGRVEPFDSRKPCPWFDNIPSRAPVVTKQGRPVASVLMQRQGGMKAPQNSVHCR